MASLSQETNVERHLFDPGEIGSMAHMTHIDRRKCQRTVPMKVLGLGVSRTGTVSLRQALIELGFGDCYHYSTVAQENPNDQRLWLEALEGKYEGGRKFSKADWDQLLGHCQSITDTPCTIFWEELLDAYPDAKVILTVRDSPEAWISSQNATIMPFFDEFVENVEDSEDVFLKLNKMILQHYSMFRTLHKSGDQESKQWYEDYIAAVKNRVPANNLLVFNVKEGWGPLCDFLEVAVPDRPFPKRNDRVKFNQNLKTMRTFIDSQKSMSQSEILKAAA